MNCFKNLIFLFLIFSNLNFYAQGGWDIGYIVSDSIDTREIGKRIKVDFKKENVKKESIKKRPTEIGTKFSPVWIIRKKDSIQLTIETEDYFIYEVRKIGVDYGYFDDQYLIFKSKKRRLRIFESEILDIKEDKIHFRFFKSKRKKIKSGNSQVKSIFKDIWIEKKLIDGVMYKQ